MKKGQRMSDEQKAKIAATNRATWSSPKLLAEHSAKLKGRTVSPEARMNMSLAQKGKSPSLETRLKLSQAGMGHSVSAGTRAKIGNGNKGKVRTADEKATNSAKAKERWASPDEHEKQKARLTAYYVAHPEARQRIAEERKGKPNHQLGKKRTAEARQRMSELAAERRANGVYKSPSSTEGRVYAECLSLLGVEVKKQYHPKGFNRVYDFFVPALNLLIEVDGEYWHHSDFAILRGIPKIDAQKDKWASENGLQLMRIKERDITTENLHTILVNLRPALRRKEIEV